MDEEKLKQELLEVKYSSGDVIALRESVVTFCTGATRRDGEE